MGKIIIILVLVGSLFSKEIITINHADYKPFSWSEKDVSKGIYVDVMAEVEKKLSDVEFKFKQYPWKRAQLLVREGKDDAFITVPTPERLTYTDLCETPLVTAGVGLFTYKNNRNLSKLETITEYSDLKLYSSITYFGDGWAKKELSGIGIKFTAVDLEDALKIIANKKAEIFPQTKEVTLYNIKKLKLKNKVIVVPGVNLESLDFNLMISKKSNKKKYLKKINQILKELSEKNVLTSIYSKYK